jgi:hypothetical protein
MHDIAQTAGQIVIGWAIMIAYEILVLWWREIRG